MFVTLGAVPGCLGTQVNTTCNAANSLSIIEAACKGKSSCTVNADTPTFGDPCYGTVKYLDVQVRWTLLLAGGQSME